MNLMSKVLLGVLALILCFIILPTWIGVVGCIALALYVGWNVLCALGSVH